MRVLLASRAQDFQQSKLDSDQHSIKNVLASLQITESWSNVAVAMSMASSLSPNLKAKLAVVETSTKFSKPPDFTVPPPPIPHFVDPLAVGAGQGGCSPSHHPVVTEASEDVVAADKMLTNNDLMHLSSYLIVGCILLMVLFTVAACSLRCCTSTASDWQEEALLDNCGDDEEVDAHSSDQQPKQPRQPRGAAMLGASRWLVWKQRLWQTLRHFGSASPPQYSINEDNIKPPMTTKDWPLTNLDVEAAGTNLSMASASEAPTAVHLPLPAPASTRH